MSSIRRVARASIALLAAMLAITGCGGGGNDRLSRPEFVSRADAICAEYEGKLNALGTPQNPEQLADFADKALPIARDGREELGELRPPEDLEETYDAWLEQGDRAIEIVEDLRDAAEDGDVSEIQRIAQEAQTADVKANRLAAQLGFERCGETAAP